MVFPPRLQSLIVLAFRNQLSVINHKSTEVIMFQLIFAEEDKDGNPKNQTFTTGAIIYNKEGIPQQYFSNINTEEDVTKIFEYYNQRDKLLYFEAMCLETGQVIKLK
jgi:hypothetical protein